MTPKIRAQLLVLGAICLGPIAVMLAWGWRTAKPMGLVTVFLVLALGWVLLAACARRWQWLFVIYFPFWLSSVAYAAYTLNFGIVPGHTLAILAMSASVEELVGLFGIWQDKWLLLPLLALLGGYLWLTFKLPALPILVGRTQFATRVLLVLSVPSAALAARNVPQLMDGLTLNPVTGSVMFAAGQLPRARAQLHGDGIQKIPYGAHRQDSSEEVHVFVIGESARRSSWSVYGYTRPTTPYLDKLKSEAFFLQHANADANLTGLAVPMILTGMTPEELQPTDRPHGTLLDLAKEGGYSTSWLVNQDVQVSTAMGVVADNLVLPPDPAGDFFGRNVSDDALLPAYVRELHNAGHPRFIGMHVIGSHWEYYRRYPPTFQRFGEAGRLNSSSLFYLGGTIDRDLTDAYDNSVLYTDWFLMQLVEQARQLKVPVTVTFVPDHGESLPGLDNGAAGHGGARFFPSQFEIPAFVWVNNAYRAAHPERVAALKTNAARQVRSHEFFYTEAELMGISWPAVKPERSFASASFVPDITDRYYLGGELKVIPETSANTAPAH